MSPIPPNKQEQFQSDSINSNKTSETQSEETTISNLEPTEITERWNTNYYNVDFNGVTYQQLNQESELLPTVEADDCSSDEDDCQLTEIDPDVEFEILAESRTKLNGQTHSSASIIHLVDLKDFFERKVEQECEEIFLDDDKAKEISGLMSGFEMPKEAVPEWAKSVPEEVWKKSLLSSLDAKKVNLFNSN